MTGKIISFWEYCKLNFHKVLDGTRAECRLGKIKNRKPKNMLSMVSVMLLLKGSVKQKTKQ